MMTYIRTCSEVQGTATLYLGHLETDLLSEHSQGIAAQSSDDHGSKVSYILPTPEGMDTPTYAILR